ncbi:hypothetical protein ACQSSU_12660 [Micromonospora echinospora]
MAYQLWAAIENERLNRGWTAVRMAEAIGLPRNTISRLKDSSRPAQVTTVHKVADWLAGQGLDIDRERAEELAGLRPASPATGISAREAIERDPMFTPEQRRTMLDLYDMLTQINRPGGDQRQAG